jgi:hypothetical protein
MAKILSRMNERSDSYRVKIRKLKEMVNYRKELERMLHFKVSKNHYDYEKVKAERKQKDFYAERLRKRIDMGGQTLEGQYMTGKHTQRQPVEGHSLREQPVQAYKYQQKKESDPSKDGFFIQFDYILDMVKEFPQVQLVYGVYRRGVQIQIKFVDLVFTEDSHDPSLSLAFFDQRHTLRSLKLHSDTMLIVELQVPERDKSYANNAINTANKDAGEINNMKTYAWTCIDLFNTKRGLKEGAFKVPFYRPPTALSVTKESIGNYIRISPTLLYMRIMRLDPTAISDIICNPAYKEKYVIHDFHDFTIKPIHAIEGDRNKGLNANNFRNSASRSLNEPKGDKSKGLNITVHYVKGVIPNTHVRVACCLQVGQDILRVDSENL